MVHAVLTLFLYLVCDVGVLEAPLDDSCLLFDKAGDSISQYCGAAAAFGAANLLTVNCARPC